MMNYSRWLATRSCFFPLCFLVLVCGCWTAPQALGGPTPLYSPKMEEMQMSGYRGAPSAISNAAPFDPAKLAAMDAAINQAIVDKKCPGGVLWVEHRGVDRKSTRLNSSHL